MAPARKKAAAAKAVPKVAAKTKNPAKVAAEDDTPAKDLESTKFKMTKVRTFPFRASINVRLFVISFSRFCFFRIEYLKYPSCLMKVKLIFKTYLAGHHQPLHLLTRVQDEGRRADRRALVRPRLDSGRRRRPRLRAQPRRRQAQEGLLRDLRREGRRPDRRGLVRTQARPAATAQVPRGRRPPQGRPGRAQQEVKWSSIYFAVKNVDPNVLEE